jgi:N-acetylmuramoyl-L-alanine amidase
LYADVFWHTAREVLPKGTPMRGDFMDGDKDWDSNFFILTKTKCPAVLTENLFMDNESDCQYLLSEDGKKTITKLHVDAILKIVGKY